MNEGSQAEGNSAEEEDACEDIARAEQITKGTG